MAGVIEQNASFLLMQFSRAEAVAHGDSMSPRGGGSAREERAGKGSKSSGIRKLGILLPNMQRFKFHEAG